MSVIDLQWCQRCNSSGYTVHARTFRAKGYKGPCGDSFCYGTCDSPSCKEVSAILCDECELVARTVGLNKPLRVLKAEWWEVWWVKPGRRPFKHDPDGEPIPDWIPRGSFPDKKDAHAYAKSCKNRYMKVFHVRRYTKG